MSKLSTVVKPQTRVGAVTRAGLLVGALGSTMLLTGCYDEYRPVVTVEVNADKTAATVSWTPPTSGTPLSYSVWWGYIPGDTNRVAAKSDCYGVDGVVPAVPGKQNYSCTVSYETLKPNIAYYLTVEANFSEPRQSKARNETPVYLKKP